MAVGLSCLAVLARAAQPSPSSFRVLVFSKTTMYRHAPITNGILSGISWAAFKSPPESNPPISVRIESVNAGLPTRFVKARQRLDCATFDASLEFQSHGNNRPGFIS